MKWCLFLKRAGKKSKRTFVALPTELPVARAGLEPATHEVFLCYDTTLVLSNVR